jgi:hypothetical protein
MPIGVKRIPIPQREKISISVKNHFKEHPRSKEIRDKLSVSLTGRVLSESHIQNLIESRIGGFWYGNVRKGYTYPGGSKRYCELWTEDLKERIRAYWGYMSPLSGNTSKENGGRNLSCHHIYYQEKACCEWDEDAKGYYAWINIGTHRNPKQFKYYINGDPNKFVPLTLSEHIETNHNRLEWIKLFENIIEEQGGKCYFTKKELEDLLMDH